MLNVRRPIFSALLFSAILLLPAMSAAEGGFVGPGPEPHRPVTIQEARALQDDTPVTLEGQIIRRLDDDKYLFQDAAGDTIPLEIDDKDWRGVTVRPEDNVIIRGKMDKGFLSTEIEVETIRLQ